MNLNEYEFNTELLSGSGGMEMEGDLVNELMEVSNEHELESYIGKVWDAAKKFYVSPQGQAIKKDFIAGAKSFGKKMLPSIGENIGQYVGGRAGARIGQQIGSTVGNKAFGRKVHQPVAPYLNPQKLIAYHDIIKNAAKNLNQALKQGISGPPRSLVTSAINQAARPYIQRQVIAPSTNQSYSTRTYATSVNSGGVVAPRSGGIAPASRVGVAAPSNYNLTSGTWVRKGTKVILYGMR